MVHVPGRVVAELEGAVEVVDFGLRLGHQLTFPGHEETRVPKVGRVYHALASIQSHQTDSTATCTGMHTSMCMLASQRSVTFYRLQSKTHVHVLGK